MKAERDGAGSEHLAAGAEVEGRIRKIFLGSMGFSFLVLLNFAFLVLHRGNVPYIIRVSFPPLLLWSFVVTGYAFQFMGRLAAQRRQMLEEDARSDPKTGVRTLAYVKTLLEKEYEAARLDREAAAVLYVDLENLDVVNRDFGHAVGDVVLKDVAQLVQHTVPAKGVVGHVAGDEFVVLLPATGQERAESVASDVEEAIAGYELALGNKGSVDFLRCRIGIIACSEGGGVADELIRVAHQAASQSRPTGTRTTAVTGRLKADVHDTHSGK